MNITSVQEVEAYFVCEICDFKMNNEDALKKHVQSVHSITIPYILPAKSVTLRPMQSEA